MTAGLVALNLVVVIAIAVALLAWRMPDRAQRALGVVGRPVRLIGWFCLAVVVLACAVPLVGLGFNFIVGGATLVVLAMVLNRRARARRDALTELMAVCSERGMPLEPVLTAFAGETPRGYRGRIERLVELLGSGVPLADALSCVRGLVSPQVVCAARSGTRTGKLGMALRDALDLQQGRGPLWNQWMGRLWLMAWPVFGILVVLLFWGAYVLPKFQMIWNEYDLELAFPGQLLGEAAASSGTQPVIVALVALATILLAWILLTYVGWLPVVIPLPRRWRIRFEAAPILRGLALFCDAQRPLVEGLAALAESYPKSWVRRRLASAACEVAAGGPWPAALERVGLLGSSDAALLQASTRVGNVGWALRITADATERRIVYRLFALIQIVFPLLMLVIGGVVLVILSATLLPLRNLIEALAE